MDATELLNSALRDGLAAAKGHEKELRGYLRKRARLIADGAARLADEHAQGLISEDDVRFGFSEIRKSEKTALRTMQAAAKAAAQDAINAMLAVAAGAVNNAIGVKLL